jgi:predicted phosphoribosyltransferase
MEFHNRQQAGQLLFRKLQKYIDKDVVVYAIPRGGVVTANEIAKKLKCPLDLIITRKIGHPHNMEYAIAAISENGHIVSEREELKKVSQNWLQEKIKEERMEIKRRRDAYLSRKESISASGKIAILVDDGVATGLTLRAGIMELKHQKPQKIIVAVPVIPKSISEIIKVEADELVTIVIPPDDVFLGAVGAYYDEFPQVTDDEVTKILKVKNGKLEARVV